MSKKIVIIGAGSMAFTPTLVSTFIADPYYRGWTIGLVDIHQESLDLMHKLMLRINKEMDLGMNFVASTDRTEILPDAEIVAIAIAVGRNEAFKRDLDIPTKYGFVQPDGESLGPGGISRALRHVPVILDIARDMERLCPNARMYNFTNPMVPITQAVNKYTSIKCTGMCIGPEITKDFACEFMGIDSDDVNFIAAGLNHFHFLLDLRKKDGTDLYPQLRAKVKKLFETETLDSLAEAENNASGLKPENAAHFFEMTLCLAICNKLGYFPGPGDGHIGEFYPQWFMSTPQQRKRHPLDQQYITKVLANYPSFYKKIKEQALGLAPLDKEMFEVGKTWEESKLNDIEYAMRNNTGAVIHMNIPNKGYITNLPDGVVVELPVLVDAAGYHPLGIGDMPKTVLPYLARHAATIDLMIEAALEGSREKAFAALANDPSCYDLEICEKCLNELIDAQLEHLPLFRK